MASASPQPNWQPISRLPLIAEMITGMAAQTADFLQTMRQAENQPYLLDDATVNRVIAVYTEQRDDLWLYEEQIRRWQAGRPTSGQLAEIDRLTHSLTTVRADLSAILDLAQRLKSGTINAVLARSDLELGIEALMGRPTSAPAKPSANKSQPPEATPPETTPEGDDEYDFLDGERLTPTMRALLQVADCLVSPAPIPRILLVAPLAPHAAPEGQAAIAALLRLGWLAAPTSHTLQLTSQARTFLARRHSEEQTQITVVQALCNLFPQLIEQRDIVALKLLEPHLLALAQSWDHRDDHYALALNLTAGMYLNVFGSAEQARPYLDRAAALDAALDTGPSAPRPLHTGRR